MDVNHLRALVSDDFAAVNNLIFQKIQSEIALIDDLANHIIRSGGKRLRPLIVLLGSRACNYQGRHHITLAAMIEFFHTATLLHDDVVDESNLRRGRKTAHKIWGSKASILVGDYLLTQYMQLMLEVGNFKIMQLLTDLSYQIGRGEIKQLENKHNITLSVKEYFDVIQAKTSLLFAASATLCALVSESNEEIQHSLYTYGLHLGTAFQLIDDALDYCSDAETIGKNIGDDLADGKATLPLLYVLEHGTLSQQEKVKESIVRGTLDFLPEILDAIASNKAIDYTRSVAETEVEKAIAALKILPESVYKSGLIELAKYAVIRTS